MKIAVTKPFSGLNALIKREKPEEAARAWAPPPDRVGAKLTLLNFDLRACVFKNFLYLRGLVLVDPFLNWLRGPFNKILSFL